MHSMSCPLCGLNVDTLRVIATSIQKCKTIMVLYHCPVDGSFSLSSSLDEALRNSLTNLEKSLFRHIVTARTGVNDKLRPPQEYVPFFKSLQG